jgi:hypothetical protein
MSWLRLQRGRGDHQRDQAERDVDEEDPLPAGAVGEEPAEDRAEHGRGTEDGGEVALVPAALAGRDDVADGGHRERHQAAATEALDRAERDQLLDVRREAGEQGADQERHDRDLEQQPAAVQVGDLAPQRGGGGGREHVRRDDPGQLVEAAEVGGDAGEGGSDDALVERRQEHAHHQATHHHQDLAVAEVAV